MKINLKIKKADIVVIGTVLLATILIFTAKSFSKGNTLSVFCEGKTIHEIKLSDVKEQYTLGLKNGMVILINQDFAQVISSSCKGKDCVNCGKLTAPGDIAVCIPNKTVLKISGENKNSPDIMTY